MKTFALCGNPNCGKTTLFNALTGSTAHVGNWPGVTVDKREGTYKKGKEPLGIMDLPGIYSLSPYTPEEKIARDYILGGGADCIINIVDATNLERNLYLTLQLLETDVPVVVALNMMDEVEKSGDKVDVAALERELGVPVVAVSATKGRGIKELMERAAAVKAERKGVCLLAGELTQKRGTEDGSAHNEIAACDENADTEAKLAADRYDFISSRLAPLKTKAKREKLTKSDKIDKVLTHRVWAIPLFALALFLIFHLTFSENLFYLNGFTEGQAWMPSLVELGLAAEENGEIIYNNFGVEILAIFYDGAVFSPGVILTNFLNLFLNHISSGVVTLMENGGAAAWATGFVGDGVLGGIFAVLGFLPQILVLFMFFSLLEDTGYMARIAFVLDRLFRKFGLSGRAFMPMIMGFGCSVPAAINTRTLADERERTATLRVIPFFSCGAKLPILLACGGALCAKIGFGNADLITYSMYLLGIAVAIVSVLVMRGTTLKGETPPFIMELPAYRLPKFKNLMLHLWDKTKHFVKKAFTVIFASTVIIWLASHLSFSWKYLEDEAMNNSILAQIGGFIQPLFTPLGFGSQLGEFGWVFAVAAITGLIAKENVIATFGTLAGCIAALGANVGGIFVPDTLAGVEGVTDAAAMISATGITGAGIIAFIAFNMTTIPCFAACAATKGELPKGKFKFTLLFWIVTSYTVGAAVYTMGNWWWSAFIWAAAAGVAITLIVLANKGVLRFKRAGARRNKSKKTGCGGCCGGCSGCGK